jgi:hypothetical protein
MMERAYGYLYGSYIYFIVFCFILLCWVGVHYGIYKGSYKIWNMVATFYDKFKLLLY